ncbi:MAG: CRISPR-associated endonuclease Cas1, partial [Terriglobia bacterium]
VRMVAEKLARSAATLRACSPATDARRDALAELAKSTQDIKVRPPRTVNDLRGIEGRAAVAYFRAWRSLPLHWKGVGRHPIPEDWHHIVARARPNRVINRRATHPMNAILNYSYALLQSQIHIAVVGAGLDPTVGLMHTDRPDRPAFVLDLMEPLRPVVDTTALQFVQANTFAPQDFTIGADGTCRLHPALARRVVSEIGDIRGVESLVADFLGRVGRRNLRTVTPRPHHRISAAANER